MAYRRCLVNQKTAEIYFYTLHSFYSKTANITQHHVDILGDVMVGNITFLMIFAFFDLSPLTLWINCSF